MRPGATIAGADRRRIASSIESSIESRSRSERDARIQPSNARPISSSESPYSCAE